MDSAIGIEWDEKFFTEKEKINTPERIEGFLEEMRGKREYDKFTMFDNEDGQDEMVYLRDIEFYSFCSHHLLPFTGRAHVAYIPDDKIIGISKLARAVDKFASKPQVQEQLTHEVAEFLDDKMEPKGVMVVMEAQHLCMRCRGVEKQESKMGTSAIRGIFADPPEGKNPREEFLGLIQ